MGPRLAGDRSPVTLALLVKFKYLALNHYIIFSFPNISYRKSFLGQHLDFLDHQQ
jgi:hypothetical protein